MTGGAPSAPELVRKIKEVWPKSSAGNGWGMTETSATATSNSAEDYEHRPDSCGPPVPVTDLKIMSVEDMRRPAAWSPRGGEKLDARVAIVDGR